MGCHSGIKVESIGHISQSCPDTWGLRINRHNAVMNIIVAGLMKIGWETRIEPTIPVGDTNKKPDILCWDVKEKKAWIIDVQIVLDPHMAKLERCHARKKSKYDLKPIKEWVKGTTGSRRVEVTTATLSWRGCWAEESAYDLQCIGLRKNDLKIATLRVLHATSRMVNDRFKRGRKPSSRR